MNEEGDDDDVGRITAACGEEDDESFRTELAHDTRGEKDEAEEDS